MTLKRQNAFIKLFHQHGWHKQPTGQTGLQPPTALFSLPTSPSSLLRKSKLFSTYLQKDIGLQQWFEVQRSARITSRNLQCTAAIKLLQRPTKKRKPVELLILQEQNWDTLRCKNKNSFKIIRKGWFVSKISFHISQGSMNKHIYGRPILRNNRVIREPWKENNHQKDPSKSHRWGEKC